MIEVSSEFKDWAVGFSGMDGGNLDADIWFCGIESGGQDNDMSFSKLSNVPCWKDSYPPNKSFQFMQKMAKIALSYEDKALGTYKQYLEQELLRSDGNTFHMNLYPLAFKNSDHGQWGMNFFKKTGFPNKLMYRAWCMECRFPYLKQLVYENKPKVLLCVGNSFEDDFKLAFLGADKLFDDGEKIVLHSGKVCKKFLINKGETAVLITPFLGQGGLMRDEDLKQLGQILRNDKSSSGLDHVII